MAWSPSAPAVITALLAAFRAAPALAGADIRDGPEVTASANMQAVIVGWYGQAADDLAVDGTIAPEGLAASPDRESYQVHCAALALDGDGKMTAARAAAYALAAACGAAVISYGTPAAQPRTLGGLVLRAWVASASLRQDQATKGALATVEFAVAVEAYTAS